MNIHALRLAAVLTVVFAGLGGVPVSAQQLEPGNYFWYVPEHEKYGRTTFYARPAWDTSTVRVTRAQRFKFVDSRRGWAMIEFDVAGKAFIHLRVLSNLTYNPKAEDGLYEFQRASVFAEEPKRIEARLKGQVVSTPSVVDSKTPSWKNYKDSWNIRSSPSSQAANTEEGGSESTQTPSRPLPGGAAAAKSRSRYPLLTPIGSEPQSETDRTESTETDPNTVTPR